MWFKHRARNRRLSPGRVLDVKLRSDQVRAARVRFAARAVSVGLGTVFGLYILWRAGDWSLDKFVYDNPAFAISQVDVETDGIIAPEQLRRWSGVDPGANLIGVNLADVKQKLEMVSTVESVSIERVLPRTLKIRVTERRPVAQVNLIQTLPSGEVAVPVFQLDAQGYVMQPVSPRISSRSAAQISQLYAQLPALTGVNLSDLRPGHPMTSPEALGALQLISAFGRSPMVGRAQLRSADISAPGVIEVTTDQGAIITFAPDHLDQQLERWRLVYDWGRSAGKEIASLDLAVGNNVPVKWNFIAATPAFNSKPAKPLNLRRRNV